MSIKKSPKPDPLLHKSVDDHMLQLAKTSFVITIVTILVSTVMYGIGSVASFDAPSVGMLAVAYAVAFVGFCLGIVTSLPALHQRSSTSKPVTILVLSCSAATLSLSGLIVLAVILTSRPF